MQNVYQLSSPLSDCSPEYIIKTHLNNFFNERLVLDNVIQDRRLTATTTIKGAFRRLYLNLCYTYENDTVDAVILDMKLKTKCLKLLKSA